MITKLHNHSGKIEESAHNYKMNVIIVIILLIYPLGISVSRCSRSAAAHFILQIFQEKTIWCRKVQPFEGLYCKDWGRPGGTAQPLQASSTPKSHRENQGLMIQSIF